MYPCRASENPYSNDIRTSQSSTAPRPPSHFPSHNWPPSTSRILIPPHRLPTPPTMTAPAPTARHLYRSLLRELPTIPTLRTTTASKSQLHQVARQKLIAQPAVAEQFGSFLKAQRMYVTLLERYNPGLAQEMDTQEHVKRTANRVGLKTEFKKD